MAKIKIEVRERGKPAATITVPLWMVRGAKGLLPKAAGRALQDQIDIDAIVRAAGQPGANGVILQIEDHEDGDMITISIVGDEPVPAPQR